MKPCPSCGARNTERSQFCNDCGGRLPAAGGVAAAEALPGDRTGPAEPSSVPVFGEPAPAPAPDASETPPAPSQGPMPVEACGSCGYRIPGGQVVSWCPGCGRLFDIPVAGAPVAGAPVTSSTPVPAAPPVPGRKSSTETLPPGAHSRAAAMAAAAVPPGWALVLLRAGERLDRHPLRTAEVILGRTEGDINFSDDPMLSPRHARLFVRDRTFWLEDAGSRNGVYLRLPAPGELRHGDFVTFGSLVFRYESEGGGPHSTSLVTTENGVKIFGSGREKARGRIVRVLQDGADGPAYPLTPARTIVGRKMGHFLFPDDPLLSRQHAQFYERDGEMWVEDLGSSNGTMVRIRGPIPLSKGQVFRVGDVTLEVSAP